MKGARAGAAAAKKAGKLPTGDAEHRGTQMKKGGKRLLKKKDW